jgi:hypothetical protein
MPSHNKKKKSQSRKRGNDVPGEQIYRGPLVSKDPRSIQVLVPLKYISTVQSTAGGVNQNSYSFQGVVNTINWASFSASFAECRVRSIFVEYVPQSRYSQALTNSIPPLYVCSDRRDSTLLSSLNQAAYFDDVKICSLSDPWKHSLRMFGTDEQQFVSVSNAATLLQPASIKYYNTGCTATLLHGSALVTYMVEFRGLHS